jgi:hypothetical protein
MAKTGLSGYDSQGRTGGEDSQKKDINSEQQERDCQNGTVKGRLGLQVQNCQDRHARVGLSGQGTNAGLPGHDCRAAWALQQGFQCYTAQGEKAGICAFSFALGAFTFIALTPAPTSVFRLYKTKGKILKVFESSQRKWSINFLSFS